MRLLRGLRAPVIESTGCVATIGNFDGVHLGHQSIIQQVISKSQALGLPSVVIIFEPQPLEFFKGPDAPARLLSFREKYQALASFELDYVYCLKFNAALSQLTAQDFISQVLIAHLQIKHLVIGDDFRFGSDRKGDFSLLRAAGLAQGFSVENTPTKVDDMTIDGQRISSTRLRECLAAGDFQTTEQLLGRPYAITGTVIHGQKLGRKLGFATANIGLNRINVPLSGVYVVRLLDATGKTLHGVANIGVKPTVGNFKPSLEVHVLDFDGELYGQRLTVIFISKLREEQRFSGLEALKRQIEQDVAKARTHLALESTN